MTPTEHQHARIGSIYLSNGAYWIVVACWVKLGKQAWSTAVVDAKASKDAKVVEACSKMDADFMKRPGNTLMPVALVTLLKLPADVFEATEKGTKMLRPQLQKELDKISAVAADAPKIELRQLTMPEVFGDKGEFFEVEDYLVGQEGKVPESSRVPVQVMMETPGNGSVVSLSKTLPLTPLKFGDRIIAAVVDSFFDAGLTTELNSAQGGDFDIKELHNNFCRSVADKAFEPFLLSDLALVESAWPVSRPWEAAFKKSVRPIEEKAAPSGKADRPMPMRGADFEQFLGTASEIKMPSKPPVYVPPAANQDAVQHLQEWAKHFELVLKPSALTQAWKTWMAGYTKPASIWKKMFEEYKKTGASMNISAVVKHLKGELARYDPQAFAVSFFVLADPGSGADPKPRDARPLFRDPTAAWRKDPRLQLLPAPTKDLFHFEGAVDLTDAEREEHEEEEEEEEEPWLPKAKEKAAAGAVKEKAAAAAKEKAEPAAKEKAEPVKEKQKKDKEKAAAAAAKEKQKKDKEKAAVAAAAAAAAAAAIRKEKEEAARAKEADRKARERKKEHDSKKEERARSSRSRETPSPSTPRSPKRSRSISSASAAPLSATSKALAEEVAILRAELAAKGASTASPPAAAAELSTSKPSLTADQLAQAKAFAGADPARFFEYCRLLQASSTGAAPYRDEELQEARCFAGSDPSKFQQYLAHLRSSRAFPASSVAPAPAATAAADATSIPERPATASEVQALIASAMQAHRVAAAPSSSSSSAMMHWQQQPSGYSHAAAQMATNLAAQQIAALQGYQLSYQPPSSYFAPR